MKNDNHSSTNIQSTMIGPLYARAIYTQLFPELLQDNQAINLMEKVKILHPDSKNDFAILEEFIDEFLGLYFIIRARTFDDTIRKYIEKKPDATILNLGCGLDTTLSRVDNGSLLWYDLDLPDSIEYRRQLIPETEKNRYIPKSIFESSWMDDVSFTQSKGLLMIAGGLFAYFNEMDVSNLFKSMAEKFPGGEIIFDSSSARGNWFINRRFRKFGIVGIEHKFQAKNPKQIEGWSSRIQVIDWFPFFSNIEKNPSWTLRSRILISLNSRFGLAKFIHARFLENHHSYTSSI